VIGEREHKKQRRAINTAMRRRPRSYASYTQPSTELKTMPEYLVPRCAGQGQRLLLGCYRKPRGSTTTPRTRE